MKKFLAITLAVVLTLSASPVVKAEAAPERGGFGSAMVGCCFGFRTMIAYNDGKKLHIHDILDLLAIGHIWDFFEGWGGTTQSDMQKSEPAYF
jgi:hypothetical protein